MSPVPINYIAVLVAAILNMVAGAVWYGIFSKQWMKAAGKSEGDMKKGGPDANKGYLVTFLGALVLAYVLAHFVMYVIASGYFTYSDTMIGLLTGFWAWLGFVATTALANTVFEGRNKNLYYLNQGYNLIAFLVMGALLGAWI